MFRIYSSSRARQLEDYEKQLFNLKRELNQIKVWCCSEDFKELNFTIDYLERYLDPEQNSEGVLTFRENLRKDKLYKEYRQTDDSNDKKDISEPVISFIKVFEKTPRRFKISVGFGSHILTDKVTGRMFCHGYNHCSISCRKTFRKSVIFEGEVVHGEDLDWLSEDEKIYLEDYFKEYLTKRKVKLKKIKDTRKRKQLSRDYC